MSDTAALQLDCAGVTGRVARIRDRRLRISYSTQMGLDHAISPLRWRTRMRYE